jgi:hypothetical protein
VTGGCGFLHRLRPGHDRGEIDQLAVIFRLALWEIADL